jgi:phosphoenolpyruvate carboxylase
LNPPQAESLKDWQYDQFVARGGSETLIGIEAMQNTPLTDDQIARITAAWPELRNQIQAASKAANKNLSAKELDNAVMKKILDMLAPAQIASYQDALKYGTAK